MGFFKKPDLLDIIFAVPAVNKSVTEEVKNTIKTTVRTALADPEIASDMSTLLTAAIQPFENAGKNPSTNPNLKEIFNAVADVLPVAKDYVASGGRSIPVVKAAFATGAIKKLADEKNQKLLEDAYNNNDASVKGIVDSLLNNQKVQVALERLLTKPASQGLFILKQEGNQGYAVEQLSGTKFPLPPADFIRIKKIVDAAAKKNPPKFGI